MLLPVFLVLAVPVPVPTPVAVKVRPTVLEAAPISVKSVVPIALIEYAVPTTNDPALVDTSPYMELTPEATLLEPVRLEEREPLPEATLLEPVVLERRELAPEAVLELPVVLERRDV